MVTAELNCVYYYFNIQLPCERDGLRFLLYQYNKILEIKNLNTTVNLTYNSNKTEENRKILKLVYTMRC